MAAVLLAATFTLPAQSRVPFNPSDYNSFGRGPITVQVLSYVGFGYHLPTSGMKDKQRRAFNNEFFLNILELRAQIIDDLKSSDYDDWTDELTGERVAALDEAGTKYLRTDLVLGSAA